MVVSILGRSAKGLYGYQPKSRNNYSVVWTLLYEAVRLLLKQKDGDTLTLVSCGFQGADQLFFDAARFLADRENEDVVPVLFLTSPSFGSRWKEIGLFSKTELEEMKDYARERDSLEYFSLEVPKTKEDYFLQETECIKFLVQISDVVILVKPLDKEGTYLDNFISKEIRSVIESTKHYILIDPDTAGIERRLL